MADGGYNLFSATGMTMTPLGMVAGNTFDFNKPIINSLKVMPIRFLNSGIFPPYYGDEISLGFWSQLGIGIGTSSQSTSSSVTVVCMGDSLTYGAGGGPGTPEDPGGGGGGVNWPDEWENLSNYNVINKGINGHTSGQMLARFNDDVIALRPDYCIIECGTNDAHLGVSLTDCKVNIRAMVDLCLANNIKPILAHYIQRYNQMQLALNSGKYTFDPDYMAQYLEDVWGYEQSLGYPCILFNESTDIDNTNANMNYFYNTLNDYIHPNADGYVKWAGLINNKLGDLSSKPIVVKKEKPVIVAIGSSLTALHPVVNTEYPAWTSRFEELSGYVVINVGIDGNNTGQMIERFWTDIISIRPDYCIMEVGINDCQAGDTHPLETTKRLVHSMSNLCKLNMIEPIFVVAVPPYNLGNGSIWTYTQLQSFRDRQNELKDYIQSLGYNVYPYFEALETSTGYIDLGLTFDDVHPNSAGNKLLGDMLYSYINNLEKEQKYKVIRPEKRLKIVVIGDSITAGYPYTDNKPGDLPNDYASWTAKFRELTGYEVINQAIGGTTMVDTEARFMDDVVALHPDYCIVENGNDVRFGLDNFNLTAQAIDSIISMCLNNNIKLIFVQPVGRFNMEDYVANPQDLPDNIKYWHMMHEYETSKGYNSLVGYYTPISQYLDNIPSDTLVDLTMLTDGVHPTLVGYETVGEWLTRQLIDAMSEIVEVKENDKKIYTLEKDYRYVYNLSKKTFTIYDENGQVIFYKAGVYTMSDMCIDFTVHKSHQFEIIVDSQDLSGWDYIPVSTLPQEYNFGNMEVSNEGVHNIYLPDRVRPYAKNDVDNPSWCIKYMCGYKDFDLAISDIKESKESESGKLDIDYIYTLQKPFSSLYYVNTAFYNSIPTNVFYCEYASWFSLNKDNTIFNGLLQDFCKLLLPKLSLSLYPMLNPVIRGSTKTSSVYELGPGSASIVEQEDGAIHREYISINGEVVAIVEYYDDGKHVHLKVEIKTATGWEVDKQELPTGVVIETEVEPGGRLVINIIDGESINNRPVYEPWLIKGVEFVWPKYTEDLIEEFYIDILDLSPIWD